jgi:6-pyruvoyltetrahydropterin/6-carboxytetrahydropterin synthase
MYKNGGNIMYILKTEDSFDSAHFLSGYDGKCKNIHGHRWRVVLEVKSKELEAEGQTRGMVVDFSKLKADLKSITDSLDHTFIYEKNSLKSTTLAALKDEDFKLTEVDFRPTAENFSKYFFDIFTDMGYEVKAVSVYETPNNCAVYSED